MRTDEIKITVDKVFYGNKVRSKRVLKGWSQEKLAFEADVHPSYIKTIEKGYRNPSYETILKIARALREPPNSFLPDK